MALFAAVNVNNLERVKLLLEQGADKEKGDRNGSTPLYLASYDGNLIVTQCLVEQGANLDKVNNDGDTPLAVAALYGHLDVVRYLLEQGADRDKATTYGYTPLHYAAQRGYLEIAMLLMSYGADLNMVNNHGLLPIYVASTEEIRQAIRDEPRRRMDHGHKRATEQDQHPNAAEPQEAVEEEGQSNKLPGAEVEEETKVASEDEDSEPSDGEDDSYGMRAALG